MGLENRDVVVIGAGIFGLSATYELARRGCDVVCLERAAVGHEWSGSKGSSRMFRLGYDEPLYVEMAMESLPLWRHLEAESGEVLLDVCGLLSVGHGLDQLEAAIREAGASVEYLDPDTVAVRYPAMRIAGGAVLDATAGVLRADRVLQVTAELARAAGAELRQGAVVFSLDASDTRVTVETNDGTIEALRAIVCAGPGSSPLLAQIGLHAQTLPTLEQVAYFESPAHGLPAMVRRDDPPIGIGGGGKLERLGFYAMPVPPLGLYKVGLHGAGPAVSSAAWVEGADDGLLAPDPELLQQIVEAVAELLPGVAEEPRLVERCVYDNTADGDFVIDRVGPVAAAFGTSGHGFKFGPLIGSLLADLVSDEPPPIDLSRFAADRPALGRS